VDVFFLKHGVYSFVVYVISYMCVVVSSWTSRHNHTTIVYNLAHYISFVFIIVFH